MNLIAYLKEAGFAVRATANWRSCLSLIDASVRSHIHNGLGMLRDKRIVKTLDLRIGEAERRIAVRPAAGDVFVLFEVLATQCYAIADRMLDPAEVETIVDCGANIGITSLFLASRYPSARIISVEPDRSNFAMLQQNTRGEPRIVPVMAAVTRPGLAKVHMTEDRAGWGNHIVPDAGQGAHREVPALSIEDIRDRFGLGRIDLLKVDIEGAEEELFAHAGFLDHVRFIIIELHGAYSIERFQEHVTRHGFVVREPGPASGSIMITATRDPGAPACSSSA